MKKFLILLLLSLTVISYSKPTNNKNSDLTRVYDTLEITRPVFTDEKAQKFADDYAEIVYGVSKIISQNKGSQGNLKMTEQYMKKINDLNSRTPGILNGLNSDDLQTMTEYTGEISLVLNSLLMSLY